MSVPGTTSETTSTVQVDTPPVPTDAPTGTDFQPNPTDVIVTTTEAPSTTIGEIKAPADAATTTTFVEPYPRVPAGVPTTIAGVEAPKPILPKTGNAAQEKISLGAVSTLMLGAAALIGSRRRSHRTAKN